jgi:hypothetical protein
MTNNPAKTIEFAIDLRVRIFDPSRLTVSELCPADRKPG